MLANGKSVQNTAFSIIFASCLGHKVLSPPLPSIFNYAVSNAVSYRIKAGYDYQ
jgi:hypothetical protein